MTTSDQINELAAALSKAQGEMGAALKDSENPSFGSKYADLSSVWEACRAPLAKHEIAIVQSPSTDGARVSVDTFVIHRSGQWMRGTLSVTAIDDSPQAVGSAVTYCRRYSLQAFAGVAPADDDAEAAHGRMNGSARTPVQTGVDHTPYAEITHPPGYLEWLDQLRETAMLGTDALHQAWRMSQLRYTLHLKKVGGDLWPTLKDIAARKAS
jgi:ERF superfamily